MARRIRVAVRGQDSAEGEDSWISGKSCRGSLRAARSATLRIRRGLDPSQAQDALHGLLEHFDGGGSLDGLAESVAAKAGISQDQVQAFLPQVLPLLQGHAENADEGLQSVLGGIMNSMSAAGGVGGLAKGLFG